MATAANGEGDKDIVTSLFGKVFGKHSLEEDEPMGLKRIPKEEAYELYPAVTDEWADPLDSDVGEVVTLRPLLAKTSLQYTPLRLAYDADRDGWSAEAFHRAVNTFGPALVAAETEGGARIGGYNPSGWIGLGEDRDSLAAFLYTWRRGAATRPGDQAAKLPKVGGAAQAVLDREGSGPLFGPDGLRIPLQPGDPRRAYSKLGSYYARLPDGGKTLFADGEETRRGKGTLLRSLRVYVAEGGPEEFRLDGVVWTTRRAGEA